MAKRNRDPLDAGKDVQARAHALMLELYTHQKECKAAHPELANEDRMIFEGWMIQKVAGLQISVERLVEVFHAHRNNKHTSDPDV
jgi:hypothetical protein